MRIPALLIVLASVGVLAVCTQYLKFYTPYPPDRVLEERFQAHEADFNRLAEMFKEDVRLSGLKQESAWAGYKIKADIPQQRLNEYRSLLKKLGVQHIGRGEKSGHFSLLVWNDEDFLIGGSSKFYIYADWLPPPSPTVDSLDMLKNSGHDAYAFKKIEEDWYLHLDIW